MSQSNKWSFACFGFILMAVANWKYLFDLLQWSQEISTNYFMRPKRGYEEVVEVLGVELNCGIRHPCPENSFSIFLSTGAPPENQPKLCVDGKYIIKPLKKEGRGLNAAVVKSDNFQVVSVRNFDTYLYNKSVEISEWIDGILNNDILIIFTSDEASARLSGDTKNLLNNLGSGKIQNLQYRSQWYMLTQKGTQGFTIYEKITYSKKKNWGEPIEFRGCIPRKIPKKITTADEPLRENRKKVQFCAGKKSEQYKGLCNEPRFEIIMPALLTNKSLVGNIAYSLPIFLYASKNLEILISSMDNLVHQPGIVSSLITVLYENNVVDIPSLARIYGMHSNKTKFEDTFEEKLKSARAFSNKYFPKKQYLIVIDSDVIPSPDFLFFFAQILPFMEKDREVSAISGWSSNCYSHDGSVHLVYRIKKAPKYAALISATSEVQDFNGEIFAPDVARVQGLEACHPPSLESNNWIERPQDLLKNRYYHKMVILQQLSQVVDVDELLRTCSPSVIKNETNAVYIPVTEKPLSKILGCLGVIKNNFGEYYGVIRLFVNGKSVLVITSKSSFYKSRPIS